MVAAPNPGLPSPQKAGETLSLTESMPRAHRDGIVLPQTKGCPGLPAATRSQERGGERPPHSQACQHLDGRTRPHPTWGPAAAVEGRTQTGSSPGDEGGQGGRLARLMGEAGGGGSEEGGREGRPLSPAGSPEHAGRRVLPTGSGRNQALPTLTWAQRGPSGTCTSRTVRT